MSSPIPSRPSPEPEILERFSKKLDELPGDTAKVIGVMENILRGTLQPPLESELAAKVIELQKMLDRPAELSKEVNTEAIKVLKGKMKGMVESKIQHLLVKEILTEIPPHRISTFVDTVEGFYRQARLEGQSHQEASTFALGNGMLRSMINLPNSDEIEANAELKDKIEADPELQDYICPITLTLVGSDAFCLKNNPKKHYHEGALKNWVTSKGTDPLNTRTRITADDIQPDLEAREFVEKKLFTWLYPELTPNPAMPAASIKALQSKAFLLALAASYPSIKEDYEKYACQPHELHTLIKGMEGIVGEKISRFTHIVEWIDPEKIPPSCFSVIKELLRQAEEGLTDENAEEIKDELIGKVDMIISLFNAVECNKFPYELQERIVKIIEDAAGAGKSFSVIRELVQTHKNPLIEEYIRKTFPECLIGKQEWEEYVGFVNEKPFPEGIIDILNESSPSAPDKKKGETHTLVLIPTTISGHPFTLNLLEDPIRRCFPQAFLSPSIFEEYGDEAVKLPHWVLMTNFLLPDSNGKSYEAQKAQVADLVETTGFSYEVPTVLDAAACLFMTYLSSNRLLFRWTQTICCESVDKCPISIGFDNPAGLVAVLKKDPQERGLTGVAVMRKFY